MFHWNDYTFKIKEITYFDSNVAWYLHRLDIDTVVYDLGRANKLFDVCKLLVAVSEGERCKFPSNVWILRRRRKRDHITAVQCGWRHDLESTRSETTTTEENKQRMREKGQSDREKEFISACLDSIHKEKRQRRRD